MNTCVAYCEQTVVAEQAQICENGTSLVRQKVGVLSSQGTNQAHATNIIACREVECSLTD